jgi:acyl-[acyl-carrier-protein]-phospholipid O-acyltransferase/long-chain-fatty-acid--[acyl-carrier-protein] ligase
MPLLSYLLSPGAFDWLDAVTAVAGLVLLYAALAWVFPPVLRPLLWLLVRVMYRFTVHGRDRVPASGGVLVVCNHVSYVDWLVLWVACPRDPTFVLWSTYDRSPVLRFFLSWVRKNTIRIDERTDHPHAVAESLRNVAAALDAGKLVVMFPEGRLTRGGNMLPFGRGVERVLAETKTDGAVVPACTDGLWGSVFSYRGGRAFWKWPRAIRPRVAVMFGSPVPQTLPAPELRLAVQEVMADCAIRQSDFTPLVHRVFVRNAVKFRNLFRPCIIDHSTGAGRTLTWGKTFVGACCVARYLRPRLGDSPNVGVWLPTGLGGALANLAIAFLGKASVNLNYTAGADPVRSAVRQAGVRVVVTAKRFLTRFPLDLPDDIERIYLEDVLESVTKWQRIRTFLTALLLPGWFVERFVLGLHRHKPDDVLTIIFSSGSTGDPKGVVLTHRNVGSNVDSAVRTIEILPDDILFGVLPFFHSFGYTVCLWAPLAAAATALYYPDPRAAKEVGELARQHKATLFLGTATFLRFYLRRCDPADFRSLRILICGAEKLPVKLQDEFHARFGILPLEGYGCTELSPVVSTNLHDVEAGGFRQTRNVRGTVGQPILGVCVRAFTQEAREPLPTGAEGVLCAKGPNVMAGYLNQPGKTKEAVRDGWYYTGDVGVVEPEGFIRITGRVSRFAKIAGEMVPLERLEEELHDAHGGGDRVLAVTAVPDERRGERLVVLYLPELEGKLGGLLDALRARGLPNLWVPDVRDCYKVEALPVLGSGKLDLKKVGELAKELAGAR